MVKCDICNQEKDESELTFLYHKQIYICKECEDKLKLQDEDDYLEYMYSTGGFEK
ncbi:MAG: hypothetical protein PHI41_06510 [Erysipelotrichaceae bacterium]|nr:hypothetical protein [Erysipelotrichaceae bacterium]MDD3810211.1 hypothetical protein [Erysipelotrichaceae bacterium]